MGYTVTEYEHKHGHAMLESVATIGSYGSLIAEMCTVNAFEEYGFDPLTEDDMTELQKEMVAVTALYNLLATEVGNNAIEGVYSHIEIGSDGLPRVSFYDRFKMRKSFEDKLTETLTHLQRVNGFVPYLAPTPSDVPFVHSRIEMLEDTEDDD